MGRQGYCKQYAETGYSYAIQDDDTGVSQVGLYGSVLRIDGSMLPVDWNKYSIGSLCNTTMQLQVQGVNLSANQQTPTLFIQVVQDGLLEIDSATTAQYHKGVLTEEDVAKIRQNGQYGTDYHPMLAGNIFSNILDRAKNVAKFAIENKDTLKNLGVGAYKAYKSSKGGRVKHHRRHMKGGSLEDVTSESSSESEDEYEQMKGGKLLSKSALKKRL
jgi:hypothetical protein